jgi:hypothetical protein
MRYKSFIAALLAALFSLLDCGAVSRAENRELEYKVKAAFLLNFARFTTWPESSVSNADPQFSLCVLGSDPFGPALNGVESKEIAGKNIDLRHPSTVADGLGQCRLLFVSKSEQANLKPILTSIAGQPIVTVSDIEGFATSGGIFELKDKDGRLSFVVNNTKAKESGIRISSSLLKLAIEVL